MIARNLLICIATMASAACGSGTDNRDDPRRPPIADPPAVAQKLSLGGQAQTEAAGSYQGAVNCAVALQVTAQTLRSMSTGDRSQEMRSITAAEKGFRDRARADASVTEGKLASDLQRRSAEVAENPGGQAQLAIACLRTLESDGA